MSGKDLDRILPRILIYGGIVIFVVQAMAAFPAGRYTLLMQLMPAISLGILAAGIVYEILMRFKVTSLLSKLAASAVCGFLVSWPLWTLWLAH